MDHSTLSKQNDETENEETNTGRKIWKQIETEALIDILYQTPGINILNDSGSTAPMRKKKLEMYSSIRDQLMATGKCQNEWSVKSIKAKYENMKAIYKKAASDARQSANKIGGGKHKDDSWRDTRMDHILGDVLQPFENKNDSSHFNYAESETIQFTNSTSRVDSSEQDECQVISQQSAKKVDRKRKINLVEHDLNSRIEETAKIEYETANLKHETAIMMKEQIQLERQLIEKKIQLIEMKMKRSSPLSDLSNTQ